MGIPGISMPRPEQCTVRGGDQLGYIQEILHAHFYALHGLANLKSSKTYTRIVLDTWFHTLYIALYCIRHCVLHFHTNTDCIPNDYALLFVFSKYIFKKVTYCSVYVCMLLCTVYLMFCPVAWGKNLRKSTTDRNWTQLLYKEKISHRRQLKNLCVLKKLSAKGLCWYYVPLFRPPSFLGCLLGECTVQELV